MIDWFPPVEVRDVGAVAAEAVQAVVDRPAGAPRNGAARDVAAQVEFESRVSKRFIPCCFQALNGA